MQRDVQQPQPGDLLFVLDPAGKQGANKHTPGVLLKVVEIVVDLFFQLFCLYAQPPDLLIEASMLRSALLRLGIVFLLFFGFLDNAVNHRIYE